MNWKELLAVAPFGVWAVAAGLGGSGEKAAGTTNHEGWRLAEPVHYENLTVFPVLIHQGADTAGFLTLDEALASGQAMVTEQGAPGLRRSRNGMPIPSPEAGAQVNQLVLINRSGKLLVLLAGEVVSGGKQDRIIAKDRIVAPDAEPLPLDVFCVEHGRWTGGAAFAGAKLMAHPSVREKAAVDHNQSQVWAAVAQGSTAANLERGAQGAVPPMLSPQALGSIASREAPTGSYAKIYQSRRVSASVENFAEEVERRFARATSGLKGERVAGVVVAYGGEVAWSDMFPSGALFQRYWPKLLRSYVVEALARPASQEHASLDDAEAFLQPLAGRENIENQPGVYRWREVVQGRYAQIELDALDPKQLMVHWVKIHRTS